MKKLIGVVGLIFFLLLVLPAQSAFADTVALEPIADSTVISIAPTDTYGNFIYMRSSLEPPPERDIPYLKFDLSSIPKNSTISNATFQLFVYASTGADPIALEILRATEPWYESTINWESKADAATPPAAVASITSVHIYQSWDMTGLVQGWVNEIYPNYGFLIYYEGVPVSYVRGFYSREGLNKPRLIVDYVPAAAAPTEEATADKSAPIITKVKVINITQSTATITWVTDENANSFVDYGLIKEYGRSFGKNDSTTNHSVQLIELKPNKQYHFRVRSKDAAGNEAISSDYAFRTKKLVKAKPAPKKERPSVNWRIILIVALSALAVLLILALVVLIVLLRRRRKLQSG